MRQHGPFFIEQRFVNLFSSKAARDGRTERRQVWDLEGYLGRDRLTRELERRGFHAIEN